VNLRDAEAEIPALHHMLDDAQARKFDLLVLYDYNRLRDLLDPVSKTLSHYGVQLYSVAQPVEPVAPDAYSPYSSDTSIMMQGLSRIISQAQISDLRRKYSYAMPRRIAQRGLPIHIPWGYRKPPGRETDRSAVPIQDPDKCALLIQAKDMLLSGKSLMQIADMLIASGQPPPAGGKTWHHQTIRELLRNPFFSGTVRFGVSQARLDPRTGRRYRDRRVPKNKIITGTGQHIPLWDDATRQAIDAEIRSRSSNVQGRKNNQFTGLLTCGVCGARLWTYYDGHGQNKPLPEYRVWRCSSREKHIFVKHNALLELVTAELVTAIAKLVDNPDVEPSPPPSNLADLTAQRSRLEDAYQAGLLSIASFTERVFALDAQIETIQAAADNQDAKNHERQAHRTALLALKDTITLLPDYLTLGEPQEINHLLLALLKTIVVVSSSEIRLEFK
jgi:hypothetical protein